MLGTLLLRPSLQFTQLHATHFLSFKLHANTLHCPLNPFKFPTAPFHPTSLHFTSLHYTSPHFTTLHLTSLHFTSLHYTSPHFTTLHLTSLHFISHHYISPHITTLHLTSLHCNFRWFSSHFYSFRFTPFVTTFLTLFLKILGLQEKIPNASAGSWFQLLMVLFTKEYFPISFLCCLCLIFRTRSTLHFINQQNLQYNCNEIFMSDHITAIAVGI